MADLDFHTDLDSVRRKARRVDHVQRAQLMLLAAGLATMGILLVAGALLTNLF